MANQLRMKVRAPRGATMMVNVQVAEALISGLTELLSRCSHAYLPGPTDFKFQGVGGRRQVLKLLA